LSGCLRWHLAAHRLYPPSWFRRRLAVARHASPVFRLRAKRARNVASISNAFRHVRARRRRPTPKQCPRRDRLIGGDDGFFGFVAVVDRFEFKLPAIHPGGAIGASSKAARMPSREPWPSACAGPLRAATWPKMILSFDTPPAARSGVLVLRGCRAGYNWRAIPTSEACR
jgi:hypothetical protein